MINDAEPPQSAYYRLVGKRDGYVIYYSNALNRSRFVYLLSLFTGWCIQLVHAAWLDQPDLDRCHEARRRVGFGNRLAQRRATAQSTPGDWTIHPLSSGVEQPGFQDFAS